MSEKVSTMAIVCDPGEGHARVTRMSKRFAWCLVTACIAALTATSAVGSTSVA